MMRAYPTDAAAIGLSGLCLLHCLALPMVISVSPVFALAGEEWVHGTLAIVATLVSLAAFTGTSASHGRNLFMSFAFFGITLLLAAAFLEALHDYETLVTVAGASLLAFAHIIRWRTCT